MITHTRDAHTLVCALKFSYDHRDDDDDMTLQWVAYTFFKTLI